MPVKITNSAKEYLSIMTEQNKKSYVHLSVSGGGCSGLQYGMALDTEVDPDDTIFDHEGVAIILSAYDQKYLLGSKQCTLSPSCSAQWTQHFYFSK